MKYKKPKDAKQLRRVRYDVFGTTNGKVWHLEYRGYNRKEARALYNKLVKAANGAYRFESVEEDIDNEK